MPKEPCVIGRCKPDACNDFNAYYSEGYGFYWDPLTTTRGMSIMPQMPLLWPMPTNGTQTCAKSHFRHNRVQPCPLREQNQEGTPLNISTALAML